MNLWNKFEPFLFVFQVLTGLRFKFHSKVDDTQFRVLFDNAFKEVTEYLEIYGLNNITVVPNDSNRYLYILSSQIITKDGFYFFLKGELHCKLLKNFNLPRGQRLDNFIIYSFLFVNGYDKYFKYRLLIDWFKKTLRFKNTLYHYFSVPEWRDCNIQYLEEEVKKIHRPDPLWNLRFEIPKSKNLKKDNPYIFKAIDKVLAHGKISERTIFNLASSEKIILIHKYSEGFNTIYKHFRDLLEVLRTKEQKLKKSKGKDTEKKINKIKEKIKSLNDERIRVPISVTLENYGFQKLFTHVDGVYVYPLSMLPEKYHKDPSSFINEVIISEADKYLIDKRDSYPDYFSDFTGGLKYLVLVHVISISEITILSQERSLGYSSPILSNMLLTSYLSKDKSSVGSFYINDLVRNVDFKFHINENTKTGLYLQAHFQDLKEVLWREFRLDIFRPINFSSITEDKIRTIVNRLIDIDNSGSRIHLTKFFRSVCDFYCKLNEELNKIKK